MKAVVGTAEAVAQMRISGLATSAGKIRGHDTYPVIFLKARHER
jgi:hypothetical protein